MKVISIDNFSREGPGYDDRLIASGLSEEEAEAMADRLNADCTETSTRFHIVRPENYVLSVWEP